MTNTGARIGSLAIVLAVGLGARAPSVGAQQPELGGSTESQPAAVAPRTVFGLYAGDIEFQNNMMGTIISAIVEKGKNFTGEWALSPDEMTAPTDIGPFKGHLAGKNKIKMTMPLPSESFPHCKVMLSGTTDDNDFEYNGTAKEVGCGKDGKALGTGSFFLTAG